MGTKWNTDRWGGVGPWTGSQWGESVSAFRFEVVTAAADTFQLPLKSTGTYDFHVDWGDGTSSDITQWDHADTNHSYAGAGTFDVVITGIIDVWAFQNLGDALLIHDVKEWGPLGLSQVAGQAYFFGCQNLTSSASDSPDVSGSTILFSVYRNCFKFNSFFSDWGTSHIINFQEMLRNAMIFNKSLSGVDTSSGVNFSGMLRDMPAFDQDISHFDITNATNMSLYLSGTTLSTANYDALILSYSAQAQTIVASFDGGLSKYTGGGAVEAARDAWIAKGWVITDGGIAP